jgi:hypothetical protein
MVVALFACLVPGCAHGPRQGGDTDLSTTKSSIQLLPDLKSGPVPLTVTLTAKIPASLLARSGDKIVLQWVEEYPGGGQYKAREEMARKNFGKDEEVYFYRTYMLDRPGRFYFFLVLSPDTAGNRSFSNRVSVLCTQSGYY